MKLLSLALIAASLGQYGCDRATVSPAHESPTTAFTSAALSTPAEAPKPMVKTFDGPLGLAMGVPVAELVGEHKFSVFSANQPTLYRGTPPKGIDGFSEYYAVATAGEGVCRLVAIANVPTVNGNGLQVKAKVDEVAELLTLKYGKASDKADIAVQDVYKRNPQYWMMGLKEQSVVYASLWESGKNGIVLPNDLAEIGVQAQAEALDVGSVRLEYVFRNNDRCEQETKRLKASKL